MFMPAPIACADRGAARLAAKHVTELRHLVEDLVHADADEVGEHQFGDRAQAGERGAAGGADDRGLGDWRVDHAQLAEARQQPLGHAEDAARGFALSRGAAPPETSSPRTMVAIALHSSAGLVERIAHRLVASRRSVVDVASVRARPRPVAHLPRRGDLDGEDLLVGDPRQR
jgi:hypothetical protein